MKCSDDISLTWSGGGETCHHSASFQHTRCTVLSFRASTRRTKSPENKVLIQRKFLSIINSHAYSRSSPTFRSMYQEAI
jgi:hypothetical protein